MRSADPFHRAQDIWAERLLKDARSFDAVAILGPKAERVPFMAALLANVSEPLDKALYGEFREGNTKQVSLPEVTPDAFNSILRAAAHLDPLLCSDTVVPTMQAAQMYMIRELEEECINYLRNVKADGLLRVLSVATGAGFTLPEDVHKQMWCKILLESEQVLHADSFVYAHGSVMAQLLRLDEFSACEEELWSRLEQWVSHAVDNPQLLGPLGEGLPEPAMKRAKLEGPEDSSQRLSSKATILQSLSKHFRFTVMDKAFFCDKVRPMLSREDSEAIMMYHILGRPPRNQITTKRSGIRPAEEVQSATITSFFNPQQAVNLSMGSGDWQVGFGYPLIASLASPVYLTKVCLVFGADHSIWPEWELTCGTEHPSWAGIVSRLTIEGRVGTINIGSLDVTERFEIVAKRCGQVFWPMAALKGIRVYGKKSREAYVVDVVNRLSVDALMQVSVSQ